MFGGPAKMFFRAPLWLSTGLAGSASLLSINKKITHTQINCISIYDTAYVAVQML